MFSFSGTEIVTIAAGETKDPARAIRGCRSCSSPRRCPP
ncbi:hypothetical protein [Streptomyces sp. NPDC051684]